MMISVLVASFASGLSGRSLISTSKISLRFKLSFPYYALQISCNSNKRNAWLVETQPWHSISQQSHVGDNSSVVVSSALEVLNTLFAATKMVDSAELAKYDSDVEMVDIGDLTSRRLAGSTSSSQLGKLLRYNTRDASSRQEKYWKHVRVQVYGVLLKLQGQ